MCDTDDILTVEQAAACVFEPFLATVAHRAEYARISHGDDPCCSVNGFPASGKEIDRGRIRTVLYTTLILATSKSFTRLVPKKS